MSLWSRIRNVIRPASYENEIREELDFHREMDRLVSIEIWDSSARNHERRLQHDYQVWRDSLKSIQDIGAFRTLRPNLIVPGARSESIRVAAMSASGFRVAGVEPLMGRYLN